MSTPDSQILPPGLSEEEARAALVKFGPNELPAAARSGLLGRLLRLLREPMLLLLLAIAVIYLFMGDTAEGIALAASAVFVIAIAYYQDYKSEKALEALRDLSSPRALVIRQGSERRIPARELVPGDLVVVHEGDRIPADGELVQASHLSVDESLLTGEAYPVPKDVPHVAQVYMGTLVVSGRGYLRTVSTGARTEMGRIGSSLAELGVEETFLAREVRGIVLFFGWTGGILCLAIVGLYGLVRGGAWLEGILAGLSTAMSLLPEEFPVVLTVFLALGAWRLSRVKVLVRKPSATERLGAITTLCVDKTGTITLNRMKIAELAPETGAGGGASRDLLRAAVLASSPHPVDPMEKAIHARAEGAPRARLELVKEYPLTKELFATTFAWKGDDGAILLGTKGAPEAVLALCRVPEDRAERIRRQADELAREGYRLLGVAQAEQRELPGSQRDLLPQWLGLLAFEDPVREEVPQAVRKCREAGIRVIMITGDYPETARRIADRAGIAGAPEVLTGAEVEALSEEALASRVGSVNVFARMRPEQKLRVVKALRARAEVVGMTGDGVNDAPSLKQADIGIAMGARGTDVAREAAGIVLTDDNFASIVAGIERGRSIFANLKKSMSYVISIHVPLAGLAFFPAVFGWPMLLMPVHIALLELLIDPTCSLLFEAQEPDDEIMRRPPRPVGQPLFAPRDFLKCCLEGLLILVPALLLYGYEMRAHGDPDEARAVSFLFLGACNVGLILADISAGRARNLLRAMRKPLNAGLLAALSLLLVLPVRVPGLVALLHFARLSADDLAKGLGYGFVFFLVAFAGGFVRARREGRARIAAPSVH